MTGGQSSPTETDKMPDEATGTVIVDLDRCLSCRSCELACAKGHSGFDDIVEAVISGANLVPRVRVVAAAGKGVPVQCQHCEDAPCVAVCPSDALFRESEDGPVRAEPEKCIGCKSCVVVCPFGAVEWNRREHSIVKCDLCEGIIAEGEQPLCVSACPTGARMVATLEELSERRRRRSADRTVRSIEVKQG